MHIIQSIFLRKQDGTSVQLYEVDLCDMGGQTGTSAERFLVNFRYGREGKPLQEGTKTTFPVIESKARALFDQLVATQRQRGFEIVKNTGEPPNSSPLPKPPASPALDGPGAERLVAHLTAAAAGHPIPRPLGRVAWRVGELRLPDAAAPLATLLTQSQTQAHKQPALAKDPTLRRLTQYSLIWAAGRCGATDAIPTLESIAQSGEPNAPNNTWIAREALRALRAPALNPNTHPFASRATPFAPLSDDELVQAERQDDILELYDIADAAPDAQACLLDIIQRIPLAPPSFRSFRRLLKKAEFRDDHLVYGRLMHRIATTPAHCTNGHYVFENGRYVNRQQAINTGKLAYSSATRGYLKKRAIRLLRRRAEANDPEFINYAMGILLAFDETRDHTPAEEKARFEWDRQSRRYTRVSQHWDSCSEYTVLNWLLYKNSPRYTSSPRARCTNGYTPGDPAPTTREEAYPNLWDRAPDALLDLLRLSTFGRVHEFAARAIGRNSAALKRVELADLLVFFHSPFLDTQRLALRVTTERYASNTDTPSELVAAMLNCGLPEARQQALSAIRATPTLEADPQILASLLLTPHENVNLFVRDRLTGRPLDPAALHAAIDRMAASVNLNTLGDQLEAALDHANATLDLDRAAVGTIPVASLLPFLNHPLPAAQLLGARLIAINQNPVEDLPPGLIDTLLASDSAEVRAAGITILARLSDEELLARTDEIAQSCLSPHPEVREAIRPIVTRLSTHPEFAENLVGSLLPVLLREEEQEGLHEDILTLLTGDLFHALPPFDQADIFRLLDADPTAAKVLGGRLLREQVDLASLDMPRLVTLGDHDIAEVRALIQQFYRDHPDRIRHEKEAAIRILEAHWEDSKTFAFDYFETTFTEADWSPDLLIAVCDSIDERVQTFGTRMITRCFQDEHGERYLLRLSQHPSERLQLFASTYLDRYAADNFQRLQALDLYFATVLSKVNKGRVAKDRAFAFLRREALKDEAAARHISHLLHRQAITLARTDRDHCIVLLRDINNAWPTLELPLRRISPPVRTPDGRITA